MPVRSVSCTHPRRLVDLLDGLGCPGRYGSRVTEAKDDAKAPAGEVPPVSAETAAVDADTATPAVETDQRKRFREALERKNATPGTHPGSMAEGGSDLKSSNGKRQRQFRRKSGG
jgi:hypothetical protein